MTGRYATHEVINQPPAFVDVDLYTTDAALQDAVTREGGGAAGPVLAAFGRLAGSAAMQEAGRLANVNPPVLETHDRQGRRRDVVHYHPAYHELMAASCAMLTGV